MNFFIVFTATLACVLADQDFIPDSQDVAAAKLAHFVEKAKAAAAVGAAPDYVTSYYLNYYKNFGNQFAVPASADITVLPSGYLADTPDVSAAKAAFFAEHAKASYAAGANPIYNYYSAPSAGSVLPNGFLAETPEVAAAKANFFAEYAKASAGSFA